MQEVQPSLKKSIHLFWSGEGSPESVLPGAKHLDPLLQMAQQHQPTPPDKGFLGTWSALGAKLVVVFLWINWLQHWQECLLRMPMADVSSRVWGVWGGRYSGI